MKLRVFRPQREPGFRLSVADLAIAAGAVLAAFVVSRLPDVAELWPLPIHVFATFFCFCNLFRIATRQEAFWCCTFVASILGTAALGLPPYPAVLVATVPTALGAVVWSAVAGKYDGVMYERVAALLRGRAF